MTEGERNTMLSHAKNAACCAKADMWAAEATARDFRNGKAGMDTAREIAYFMRKVADAIEYCEDARKYFVAAMEDLMQEEEQEEEQEA